MKKFTAILLTVVMVASLFISCNNSIEPTVTDETVSVSFSEATSRDLAASLEGFDTIKYYWAYKAEKTDSTGLNSGATSFAWVKNEGTGLSGVTIPGFSQGAWKFTLYAYKTKDNANTNLVYSGETNTVLEKGGNNTVRVTVNPVKKGNGTLIVDINNIKLEDFSGNITESIQDGFTKVVEVKNLAGTESFEAVSGEEVTDYTYNLAPAAYKVKVTFTQNDIVYASEPVVATVYSNLTTTVSGNLKEQITSATFDPSINPDVLNLTVSSQPYDLSSGTVSTDVINIGTETGTEATKVSANVPAVTAQNFVSTLKTTENASDELQNADKHSIDMSVNVATTSATNTSIAYDISMSSTITSYKDGVVTAVEAYSVESLDQYVTVKIKMQENLNNVVVKHSNKTMHAVSEEEINGNSFSADTDNVGVYYYKAEDGSLIIKTKSFSPFTISFSEFLVEMNGVKYGSLESALQSVPNDDTAISITILGNLTVGSTIEITRDVSIDLNYKTVTATCPTLFHIKDNGALTIDGYSTSKIQGLKGKAAAAADGKAVILVEGPNASLTMLRGYLFAGGEGDCGMYGIYVYNGASCVLGTSSGDPSIETWFAPVGTNNTTSPANVTINGGYYTCLAKPSESDWWAYFCAPIYAASSGNFTINRGTFRGYYCLSTRYSNVNQNITINGGYFYGSKGNLFVDDVLPSGSTVGEKNILLTGGRYNRFDGEALQNYLPESGYVVEKDEEYSYVVPITKWIHVADTSWYKDHENDTSYNISTPNQLAGLAKLVNSGTDNFKNKTINLTADIDLSGLNWTPIGNSEHYFQGTFNGNSKTISNLLINTSSSNTGFFSIVSNATITNLKINNAYVESENKNVGIITGNAYSEVTISNIEVTGKIFVSGGWYVGGINGGMSYARYENCTVDGSNTENYQSIIKSTLSGNYTNYVGGICGQAGEGGDGIYNCNVKNITLQTTNGGYGIGGIAGVMQYKYTISDCTVENVNLVHLADADDAIEWIGTIGGKDYTSNSNIISKIINCVSNNVRVYVGNNQIASDKYWVMGNNHIGTYDPYEQYEANLLVGNDISYDAQNKFTSGNVIFVGKDALTNATSLLAEGYEYVLNEDGKFKTYRIQPKNSNK